MTYIVWHDNRTEGWARSDDIDTLEEVFDNIAKDTYGHPYVITKPVKVNFVEVSDYDDHLARAYDAITRPGRLAHPEDQR